MKIRFINKTGYEQFNEAIQIAEKHLDINSIMLDMIRLKNDWQYDSGTGSEVYLNLYKERPLIEIHSYRARGAAIGMFDGKKQYTNLNFSLHALPKDLAANFVHEFGHYCGYHHQDKGWLGKWRSNYKTENKCLYSVPYWMSEYVSRAS